MCGDAPMRPKRLPFCSTISGESATPIFSSPRQSSSLMGLPGCARTDATSSSQILTGCPSIAITRSPERSPARSATPPAHILPARHCLVVDLQNGVAALQVCCRGDAARVRRADNGFRFRYAVEKKHPVQHYGEQEIRRRSRTDYGEAPPHALAIERTVKLLGGDRTLAFVEHFHIAAQRDHADRQLGPVGAGAMQPQRPAEADGKPKDLHAGEFRDQIVTVLVDDDEHRERDNEGADCHERVHATLLRCRSTMCTARVRARRSAPITSSSVQIAAQGMDCSVSSITSLILRNGRRG